MLSEAQIPQNGSLHHPVPQQRAPPPQRAGAHLPEGVPVARNRPTTEDEMILYRQYS